ncbi:unnamed protein product [Bursaphelenchus xylophilus]|uniref:(pine wood nematode) hypothetical protein n=1 Tax=Bursaphelenchus xylophilus TaxID=6326 RepID=A0A1I7S489_BURXY|nr:unnamed protein product [Bursaphelenchus xylophilus]CAG9116843.1 unnamed protein product [Bursaphelenchus xylophilus]
MAPSTGRRHPAQILSPSGSRMECWRRLTDLRYCFRKENAHRFCTKLIFLLAFLFNNVLMMCLFIWENLVYSERTKSGKETDGCLGDFEYPYTLTFHSSVAYFSLLSLLVIALMLFMQLKHFRIQSQIYFIVSLLAASTFLFSAGLVLVSAFGILFENDSCKSSETLAIIKLRFVFKSTAAFITSLLFMAAGISLNSKSRSTVSPEVPISPIYQIHPPQFDALYPPPPPTYQQSQREHRRNQSNTQ